MAAAVDKAYSAIRDGIASGQFSSGAHLTAQNLASATGLSRTPVREAMRRLHAEGLIEFIPHRGAFVRQLGEREIYKIYDLIILLESHGAEAAAQNATQDQINEMQDLVQRMEELIQRGASADEVADYNGRFHRLVVAAAHNSWLESAFRVIADVPQVMNTFRAYQPDELRRSQIQHQELLLAIGSRDAAWARAIMESHVMAARNVLIRADARDKTINGFINGPLNGF
jgi:DNA-binding GntR family transcriptional regulator